MDASIDALLKAMEKTKRGPDKDGSGQRSQRGTSDALLLKAMKKAKGGQPKKNRPDDGGVSTLKKLGVTSQQSSQWQQLADVPQGGCVDRCASSGGDCISAQVEAAPRQTEAVLILPGGGRGARSLRGGLCSVCRLLTTVQDVLWDQ